MVQQKTLVSAHSFQRYVDMKRAVDQGLTKTDELPPDSQLLYQEMDKLSKAGQLWVEDSPLHIAFRRNEALVYEIMGKKYSEPVTFKYLGGSTSLEIY